jgi:hypothetical protein
MLDTDSTVFLDDFIKGSTVRIRLEYELRNSISNEINLKASLSLSVASKKAK